MKLQSDGHCCLNRDTISEAVARDIGALKRRTAACGVPKALS